MTTQSEALIRRHALEFYEAITMDSGDGGYTPDADGLEGFWDFAWKSIEAEFAAVGMDMDQAVTAVLKDLPAVRLTISKEA
jgi:hypothetical protein